MAPRDRSASPLPSCVQADGAVDSLFELYSELLFKDAYRDTGDTGEVGEASSSRGGGCGGVSPSYGFGRGVVSNTSGARFRNS